MILTTNQLDILTRCIGGGPINTASIVIFANELGCAETGGDTSRMIKMFEDRWAKGSKLQFENGFSTLNISSPPVNSTFLQFISRFSLAIRYNDDRFFDSLSLEGKSFLNNYIMNELYRKDTAIINLRPLPRPSERMQGDLWPYENISEKDYIKQYNFSKSRSSRDTWGNLRINCLKEAFYSCKDSLILGSGDKHNKKMFLESIFPNIKFESLKLDKIDIYVSKTPNIILSNYYDNRNGIRLKGLKLIFDYVKQNDLL